MKYSHVFTPIKLNRLTLPNRIYSTAHAEVYAEPGGLPGDRYIRYYEEKAKGGLGMAICGGSSPVSIDVPQGAWCPVNLTTDRVIEPLGRLAEACHRHGMKIMIQATHMGRRSGYWGDPWPHLVSPSGVREPVHRGNSKAMEIEDIRRIVRDFALAAKRVQTSGMDGIEISAAHQQLIDQFWSPETNLRSDEYGGSLENRMRFGIEVLEAVREAVGRDFCVGLRMCADEFNDNGIDHEMAKEIAQAMSETGLIDFISVIGSGADTHNTARQLHAADGAPARAVRASRGRHQGRVEGARAACPGHPRHHPGRAHSRQRLGRHVRHDAGADCRSAHDAQGARGPRGPDQAVRRRQLLYRSHVSWVRMSFACRTPRPRARRRCPMSSRRRRA